MMIGLLGPMELIALILDIKNSDAKPTKYCFVGLSFHCLAFIYNGACILILT